MVHASGFAKTPGAPTYIGYRPSDNRRTGRSVIWLLSQLRPQSLISGGCITGEAILLDPERRDKFKREVGKSKR